MSKLLLIGSVYLPAENRKKGQALAAFFETTCVTPRRARVFGQSTEAPAEMVTTPDFRLVRLEPLGEPSNSTRWGLRGLGRLIRAERPDVLVAEAEPWALLRWQAWLAKQCFARRALFGEFSWENVSRQGFKGRVLGWFYHAAVTTGDFVVAGNRDAGELFQRYGLPASRLLVAPQYGVDATRFCPVLDDVGRTTARQRLGLPALGDAPLIGFCGRWVEDKGVCDLLAAVERLNLSVRDGAHVHLVLLGAGELEHELRAAAHRLRWLHLLPPLPHSAVAEFFQALSIFVLPSRTVANGPHQWKEQFGHVLIEAMSCGLPVVGSDSGAISEVLGEAGHIFPEGDVPALTEALAGLLDDPRARATLAAAGRTKVLALYTHEALAQTWAEFIRRQQTATMMTREGA